MNKVLNFDILFDNRLAEFITKRDITMSNEYVLSMINDYEDKVWRYGVFSEFIWNNIIETALSKKERDALVSTNYSALIRAAKNLRLSDSEQDISKGSEIAEIALYGILKHHYKALSIIPKIFYKQNTNDNTKGADSVHIMLSEDKNDFSLWFGEAKFYKSITDSNFTKIISSVNELLQPEKIKKENKIITNLKDIELCIPDETLYKKIIEALSEDVSLDFIRPKLHIPILLLYECAITAKYTEKSFEYVKEIGDYHKERAEAYFKKQINTLSAVPKYEDVHFHLIVFPVPNKQQIVEEFTEQAKIFKGK
jgi:hypothetical protein